MAETAMNKMRIVLIGPQASGKGTQAKLLKEKLGIPHISTGDMFREAIAKDTELGKKTKAVMEAGTLMPDEITNELVQERLNQDDCRKGYMLDGYPRNIAQTKALDKFSKVDKAIEISIPDSVAIKRLSARTQCRKCGAIYGISIIPEKKGICDKCGGQLYQRDDDKPEAIKKRLEIYHKETKPIIEHYRKKGVLETINGDQDVEKIFKDVMKVLG